MTIVCCCSQASVSIKRIDQFLKLGELDRNAVTKTSLAGEITHVHLKGETLCRENLDIDKESWKEETVGYFKTRSTQLLFIQCHGLLLGKAEVLRSLRHYLRAQSQGHNIVTPLIA